MEVCRQRAELRQLHRRCQGRANGPDSLGVAGTPFEGRAVAREAFDRRAIDQADPLRAAPAGQPAVPIRGKTRRKEVRTKRPRTGLKTSPPVIVVNVM